MKKNLFASTWLVAALLATSLTAGLGTVHGQVNLKVLPQSGPLTKQSMSRMLLTDVARSGNRVIAVGDRGYIVFSDSNGESWERSKTPANLPLLNGVYFSDANTVWAVGHDSTILKSTDQGKEWSSAYSSAKDLRPLMDIVFMDANSGFAVGAYGAFYETTDGGKSWASRKIIPPAVAEKKPVEKSNRDKGKAGKGLDLPEDEMKSSDEDKHLNAIVKLKDNRLLIVGEAGTLLISNDAGKTWSRLATPYKGSFFGAVMAEDGAVVIYGLRGNVYRSTDEKLSAWTAVETNTKASFMGATKLLDGTIVLAGLSGTVMLSKDGGKTFSAINSGTTKPLAAPILGGPNSLLIVGESGTRDVLISEASKADVPAATKK